ncbi:HlyC/CorC family transporter [bacterium]|nr:HlyC/CorC family transporter [bacterium]
MFVFVYLLIIFICLLFEGFFACTEMSIISSNKHKIKYLAGQGNISAVRLRKLLAMPERFLGTTLVGVNFAIIISSAVASRLLSEFVPDKAVNLGTTFFMLPLILFFGEIIPMTFGRLHSTQLSLILITPLYWAYYLLFPFVIFFSKMSELVLKMFKLDFRKKNKLMTRDELLYLLEQEAGKSFFSDYNDELIKRVFQFQNLLVDTLMVPFNKVIAVEADASCAEVIEVMHESGFSRIPVYKESSDRVCGIIRPYDLINVDLKKSVSEYMADPFVIRRFTPVLRVLLDMQVNGRQMAIVEDNNKKAVGFITMEDIMEKIVGNITDEYDAGIAR